MSKWKDKWVAITQIIRSRYDVIYGLGDDGLVYKWVIDKGKWLKYWTQEDDE